MPTKDDVPGALDRNETLIEKLMQEKEAHAKTKIELERVVKEKEEILNKIEKRAKSISEKFSKVVLVLYLPLWITIMNFGLIFKLHPLKIVLVVQIFLSAILSLTSIYMGITGIGLARKLKFMLKNALYKLFNFSSLQNIES